MLVRVSSDESARSTERPPAAADAGDATPDIAGAIQRAKTNSSPGRYGPPAATAKMGSFDLAQALAMSTADAEQVPGSSRPPRDDDAPFVAGEVEVVGEEEVNSGIPTTGDSLPPSAKAKSKPPLDRSELASVPKQNSGNVVLLALGALVGAVVIAYAYICTR